MTSKIWGAGLFLLLSLQAHAQGGNNLPDQPLTDDVLSFESEAPSTPAATGKKPVIESAPQEPPFTQSNEFEDAATSDDKIPVVEAAPKAAEEPAPRLNPSRTKTGPVSKGVEYIEHPMASKGLIRIEEDGSYIYRTKPATHDQSSTFRLGVLQPPNIQSADGQTNFKTMYTQNNIPVFMFDYEWQPFRTFGKLGFDLGLGVFTAQGNGRFLDGEQAREKYTFYGLPLSAGFVYRMEFKNKQWVAPYVAGGGTYFGLVEMRDDNATPHAVGTPAVYGAGGLMFNVSAMDRETAFTLNSEYGIANLWVTAEYRYVKTFSEDLDLSSSMINLGFAVDY